MKKILYILSVLAIVFLLGCSAEEPLQAPLYEFGEFDAEAGLDKEYVLSPDYGEDLTFEIKNSSRTPITVKINQVEEIVEPGDRGTAAYPLKKREKVRFKAQGESQDTPIEYYLIQE